MKKVKSIGKKVMSVGLAASLLLAPVGANNCCFAWAKDSQAQKVNGENSKGKDTLELILEGAVISSLAVLWGSGEFGEKISDTVITVLEGELDPICAGFKILSEIGLRNIVAGMGTWTIIKGIMSYIFDNDDE